MPGIRLIEVRVRNFRSLKLARLLLDDLTVLIGENNAGKTSLLEALNLAIGQGRRGNLAEDIYLAADELQAPKDRAAIVDLLIRPTDETGKILDNFPLKSPWLALWGNGINQDEADNDFAGLRATVRWSATKGEYEIKKKFLTNWIADPKDMESAKINEKASVLPSHIEPLALYLLDAKRDIQNELQSRTSFWGKLVSNLGLPDDKVKELEASLSALNNEIVEGSEVLAHVQEHLDQLYKTIPCEQGSVSITPLSRNLRDFNKGLDINFRTAGSQLFPLSRHGMGTRSLAAVLAFRAYTTWRQTREKNEALHSMLGLEEPESHLHPQAQRALFNQLKEIPGQKIVSTHSPYVVSQTEISKIRHFKKHGAETIITQLDTTGLSAEDLRKIDRMVMNTRGDLLYARGVILFEGETEEQALPIFAQEFWGQHPHALGLSFIGVSGSNNYLPFLRLVSGFEIPWAILSDGETLPQKALQTALAAIGLADITKCKNVAVLPGGADFEKYLLSSGYEDVITQVLNALYGKANAVADFMTTMQGQKGKGGIVRDYKTADGKQRAILDMLALTKTEYPVPLAKAIISLPAARRIPPKVKQVFDSFPFLNAPVKKVVVKRAPSV